MKAPSTIPHSSKGPERDQAVDALRGFALFGIILVNVPFFAFPIYAGPTLTTDVDTMAFAALWVLAIGKFFLIFSFLFGFGFWTSIQADQRAGRASKPRFMRRLIGLFAFGAIHAVFLFIGDILMLYAWMGVLLWFARDLRPPTLIGLSIVMLLGAIVAQTAALTAPPIDQGEVSARASAAYLGGFWDAVRFRLSEDIWIGQPFILVFNGPAALSMFLLGLASAKAGWFPGTRDNRGQPWIGAVLVLFGICLGIGGLLGRGIEPIDQSELTTSILVGAMTQSVSAPMIAAGYVFLMIWSADRWSDTLAVRGLSVIGQMTLTGYLGHSVILSFVFGGWGLALYGDVSVVQCLAIGIVTYFGLILVFSAWRKWFRYGPDEWLLRCSINWRWIRLRL